MYQSRKRFHAELNSNERAASLECFPPFPPAEHPSPPPLSFHFSGCFSSAVVPVRSLLVSLVYVQARLNCRRFSMGAVWTSGENSSRENLFIFTVVAAAKRGKIGKVYLVCSNRDKHTVVAVSLRGSLFYSSLPIFLLILAISSFYQDSN